MWEPFPELAYALSGVSNENTVITEACMNSIERFVILLYDRTSAENDINTVRKKLFAKKGRPPESIPLQIMRWCNMLGAARHYIYNLTYHVQLSGVSKKHLLRGSNRYGQHYLRLQRSAINSPSVDAKRLHWTLPV